ncbi:MULTISPECIES: CDP-diacylglycerol--serine O-phosphatidyltransferase [unclassified Mucilaginibacter]|uniref:CDP-diacylglycerol--serine O-phosphatidyltransferase n=1 Tax=unclassified Mucilaginibacter TaxID=2617802 RepID=UPI00138D3165|nr:MULTISPECIES: CDP-diacylglycerol--serine O-phosphatidyltransferase [unclassified Mucilaginibacter]MBB5397669.1 CDP-diacylglycerol--serine O-phosphatidyltransferase [Mucilaginibacter sp. AK015]QHS57686.1 CDP-diacylglycerol--serine O-phosphatidyltransferase [Mucilaginibacter sp. 14171R-50]
MRRRVKKHLPNAITCANLFSGCIGIVFTFQDNLVFAAYAIFLAAIFDFFDGFASRVLQSFSGIGKDLDSLADMVSFGVLPSAIMYELLLRAPQIDHVSEYLNFIAFLIPVFSALRLAKFNTDTRQAESFIGLPTPANAILIGSIPLILAQYNGLSRYILNPYGLSLFIVVMCTLLVAEIPLMSLKFKNRDFNKNFYRYLLLLFSAILILFFKFAAVPVVIVMYITLSLIQLKFADGTLMSGHKKNY